MTTRLFATFAAAALLAGCGSTQTRTETPGPGAEPAGTTITTYSNEPLGGDEVVVFVDGMACPMCATNVDLKLRELPGVADATVNLELGSVLVRLEGQQRPSSAQLAKAVRDSGFTLGKIVVR